MRQRDLQLGKRLLAALLLCAALSAPAEDRIHPGEENGGLGLAPSEQPDSVAATFAPSILRHDTNTRAAAPSPQQVRGALATRGIFASASSSFRGFAQSRGSARQNRGGNAGYLSRLSANLRRSSTVSRQVASTQSQPAQAPAPHVVTGAQLPYNVPTGASATAGTTASDGVAKQAVKDFSAYAAGYVGNAAAPLGFASGLAPIIGAAAAASPGGGSSAGGNANGSGGNGNAPGSFQNGSDHSGKDKNSSGDKPASPPPGGGTGGPAGNPQQDPKTPANQKKLQAFDQEMQRLRKAKETLNNSKASADEKTAAKTALEASQVALQRDHADALAMHTEAARRGDATSSAVLLDWARSVADDEGNLTQRSGDKKLPGGPLAVPQPPETGPEDPVKTWADFQAKIDKQRADFAKASPHAVQQPVLGGIFWDRVTAPAPAAPATIPKSPADPLPPTQK